MKKLLASLLSIIILSISMISCQIDNYNENITTDKQEEITEKNQEKKILQRPRVYYEFWEKRIGWDTVPNAIRYTIVINDKKVATTTNTFYPVDDYEPGKYKIDIIPEASHALYEAGEPNPQVIKITGINEEEAKKKIEEELKYSLVKINILQYDSFLGIKTNKNEIVIDGIILYKKDNKYKAICYAESLITKNYEKTEIKVIDKFDNEYVGSLTPAADINEEILSVITFYTNKNLPTAPLPYDIFNSKEIVILEKYFYNNRPLFAEITNTDICHVNGIRTKYDAINTNVEFQNRTSLPVFNSDYDLIGLTIPSNNSKENLKFIQIKELLSYIDKDLAKTVGYTEKVKLP